MYRIIAVEDDKLILELMKMMLLQIKSETYAFSKAQNVLELLKKDQSFDLIIADLTMPDVSGLDLLRAVKSNNKTKHIPILLQTGITSEAELGAAMKLADSYIIKPYRKELLIEKVLGCINKSRKALNKSI